MPLLICWIEDCRTTCKSYHIVVHSVSLCIFCIGIELGNAQNGTVDLGRFSLDNMESVTLYNGQK